VVFVTNRTVGNRSLSEVGDADLVRGGVGGDHGDVAVARRIEEAPHEPLIEATHNVRVVRCGIAEGTEPGHQAVSSGLRLDLEPHPHQCLGDGAGSGLETGVVGETDLLGIAMTSWPR
jgi:hypothetical protein